LPESNDLELEAKPPARALGLKAHPALRSIPIIAITSYALSREEKNRRRASNPKINRGRVCTRRMCSSSWSIIMSP
jgi:hypothetical protein